MALHEARRPPWQPWQGLEVGLPGILQPHEPLVVLKCESEFDLSLFGPSL